MPNICHYTKPPGLSSGENFFLMGSCCIRKFRHTKTDNIINNDVSNLQAQHGGTLIVY